MLKEVKPDLLEVLKRVKEAITNGDSFQIKLLSNYTMHNAGLFQDPDSISMAVVIYSLSKIFAAGRPRTDPSWKKFVDRISVSLNSSLQALEKDDEVTFDKGVKTLLAEIGHLDRQFNKYINEVIEQAKIKKGSKVYEHGISIGRAAELMGINTWELQNYLGNTRLSDFTPPTKEVHERLDFARTLFK